MPITLASSGSHSHYNIGFSKPGVYEVDVFVSGYLDVNDNGSYEQVKDPYYESGIFTMVFGVDFLGARDDAFTLVKSQSLHGNVTLNDNWHTGFGSKAVSVVNSTAKVL